jgi:sugar lactone lactonase YvrE
VAYGKVPLSFEPNRGQTDGRVQWVARGPEYALFLSGHDAVLELNSIAAKKGMTDRPTIDSAAVRMNLLGAKAVTGAEGEDAQAGKANYFTGRDQSKWLSEVPTFGKVRLREVYPGIDLVYYGRQGRLEYDFVVAPGADPGKIALWFDGAKAGLAANGDLVLPVNRSQKEIRFDKPTVYQMKDGVREPVAGAFRVASDGKVSFALGKYDLSRELVIDPTLVFEGEIGTGNQQTIPTGMAVDSLGEMVITGYTNDLTFPTTTGAYQTNCQTYSAAAAANGYVRCGPSSAPSAFVTKLSADGGSLIYSTYLHGGGGYEQGQSVAVDAAGDPYVLGSTSSNDFPITSNAYQTTCQPTATGTNGAPVSQCDNFYDGGGTEYTVNGPTLFIAKLNPLGTALLYSTFFGGTGAIYPVGLALDSAGNMVFASSVNPAYSTNNSYPNNQAIQFPVTSNAYQTTGINVLTPALSKLSADGQTLLYSTFLGSQSLNIGHNSNNQAFALGQNGIAFIGGYTETSDFPTTAGSFKPTCTVYANDNSYCNTNLGFVAAIDTTKSGAASLLYSSYLGGETTQGSNIPEQEVYGLTADANNNLFVTGYTYASNFPTTTGAFQTTCPVQGNSGSCPETGFLTKINPAGSALTWSTFVGGTSTSAAPSYGNAIAFDSQGDVYLYGFSQDGGGDFPQVNPLQPYSGGNKVFVTEFSADGKTELFGTRFGTSSTTTGSGTTPIANGIAVDAAGNMYIVGYTNDGGTFGTTTGTYSTPATNGFNRTFFAKFSPVTTPVPNNGLTTNLLLNPGAELGSIADWTAGSGGTPTVDTGTYDVGINPHTGSYDFLGGSGNPTDSLSQTVSIIAQGITAAQVDGGTLFANVSFWEQGLNQGDPSDSGSVTLTFLNASNAAISTVTIGPEDSHSGTWGNVTGIPAIPVGTRSITYTMNFIRNVGNNNDAFIDDNVLSIHTNTGLTISPATLHFGNVAVGSLSAQTATVTNNQTTAITIDQIMSELGADPSEFGVSTYCPQGYSLAPGASCPITISFVPTAVGPQSAGIAINSEAVPPLQQIAVDGTGTGGILQVNPGNLKTIAGIGTAGDSGDGGPAIMAQLNQPNGVAFDPSGNLYIADTPANVVRKVDTTGKITTFAGTGGPAGFSGDGGPATAAELSIPFSVASDKNGNIYIEDTGNDVIRKVDATTGLITTFAGTPQTPGHSGDGGPATAAKFNQNQGARFDSAGNLYVPTCNGASVRKIDTTGKISTVAGNFTEGFSGDGGSATAAQLQCPSGVAIDAAGNLYIADEFNYVIRKVDTTGKISTIGGTPGVTGYAGDGGQATSATFNNPNDVVIDSLGNLYVADSGNNRVRKIDTNGIITTAAGGLNSAGSAAVNTPLAVTVDTAGNVYFSDSGNSKIQEIFPQGVQPFPATAVGSTAPAQSLTLSNIGNVDVTLAADGAFTTSGNAGDFALSAGSCGGGAVLTANGGSCALSLTFTPTAVGQRTLTVTIADDALNTPQSFSIGGTGTSPANAAMPTITWATPAPITTATPLSATQLDATATDANGTAVPGTFVYTPAAGTLLAAGTQTLSVTFTPTDQIAFQTATKTVQIVVTQASGATTTTLAVTSGGETVTTVVSGSVVTLTAQVTAGGNSVSPGQVAFCDATAETCTETHLLGTAQLVGGDSTSTATYRFVPGIGAHSYKAVFLGTASVAGSASSAVALAVTGAYLTATTIAQSGTAGNYSLTATVVGTSPLLTGPTGTVSFLDTSNANAVLGTSALGASTAGFSLAQATGSPVAVGSGPYGMATGDFNGDGFADFVVENYNSGTVSVLLGKGDGTFQPQVTYAVGNRPERVLVADLDGDGKLDLVVANTGSNTIGVLLGNGDGTFKAQVTYPCASPVGLGVMDINHDGVPDVVAGDYYSNTISVLLGNGDGTLKAAVTYATGSTPQTVAEGDFNGDGVVDVVVGNFAGATVGVFLGNGDGTFQTMVTYAVGTQPQGVQVGDFNGDGKQDLGVANSGDGTVGVLLGNGDGTFQTQVTYPVGVQPVGLAIADFNGDGIEDITVGNTGQASLTQSVLLGKGDGTFAAQVAFPAGNFPYGTTVGDFNGDGLPDIVAANFNDGTATIFLSSPTQTATATVTGVSPVGTGTHAVVASYPGDVLYGKSLSQATNLIVASPLALSSILPTGAVVGSGNTTITLTGTGFATTSVVMVNETGVATTYVNPTTLTAVIPAALLTTTGSLAVTVLDPALDATTAAQTFTVVPPAGAATLSGPTTTPPASQPTVTLSITNPYPLALTAQFSLGFASATNPPVDDQSIQFSTGGRTYSYTVAANSTSVPPVQLQAGTDAGTITITAKLMADGVDVTPTGLAPLVIVVPPAVPLLSGTTITASGNTLTVVVHGFSNTREVSSAVFDFTAATGDTLATTTLTVPATTVFSTWYGDQRSIPYGSTFTYTQTFDTSADAKTVGSVKVTLTNSVGTSVASTSP